MKVEFNPNLYDKGVEEIREEELLENVSAESSRLRVLNEILRGEDECATLLELFYLEDLSWKEIGERMNITDSKGIAGVRKKKERCLKKVRKAMENKLAS